MSGAPVKKLPTSPSVSSPSVPVADRGGEEVNVGFSDLRTRSGNQLRDPRARRRAGNDRKSSHGNEFHTLCVVIFGLREHPAGIRTVEVGIVSPKPQRMGFWGLRSSQGALSGKTAAFDTERLHRNSRIGFLVSKIWAVMELAWQI